MPRFRNLIVNTSALADGAVTTSKLANLAVTTPKIANAAITTAKIDDAAITTAKIANAAITNAKIQSISASKITAGTISAQTITMGSGGLIQLSNGSIRSSTGSTYVELTGQFGDELRFVAGGVTRGWMAVSSNELLVWAETGTDLVLMTDGGDLILTSIQGTIWTNGVHNFTSWITLPNGTLSNPALRFRGANTGIWRETDAAFDGDGLGIRDANGRIATFTRVVNTSRLYWAESNDLLEYDSDNEQFRIVIQESNEFVLGTGGVLIPNVFSSTTASAANVNVAGDGRLARSTSSRRYKTAIRPWDRRASVLDLEPVLFRSRLELDDRRRVRLGLLAEDVAERFPLAAVLDAEGRPDAIDWNVITVGLLAAVRDLEGRVRQLEAAAV
jgi:hypothetical protein